MLDSLKRSLYYYFLKKIKTYILNMGMVHHFHKMVISARGTIVNIGSIGGVCPYVFGASYNATKAALHHYGNTLRVEMKPFG